MNTLKSSSPILVVAALVLGVLACGGTAPEPTTIPSPTPLPPTATAIPPTDTPVPTLSPVPTDTPLPTDTPGPTDTPLPPSPTPEPYTCVCDSRAAPINLNETLSEQMPRGHAYPSNCQRWCVCVPPDGSQLRIAVNGNVDFDLYVAWDDFEGITGSSLIYGETYTWISNSYSGNENVNLSSPVAGDYYIEVCSYNGDPGPYTLMTDWY